MPKLIALPHIGRLQEAFELDPSIPNGLRWKIKASRNTVIGSPAGRRHSNGYWEVRIDGVLYKTSRIVYKLYNNGEDPGLHEVDHRDRNKDNNDGFNLTLATRANQQSNREVTSNTAYRNTSYAKNRKMHQSYVAHRKTKDGKRTGRFLGYFTNPYEGAVAAVAYKREIGMRYEYAPGGTK
jgi:hypothetical protein